MRSEFEGLKEGLKQAFAMATMFEAIEMIAAKTPWPQMLDSLETGIVVGIGVGVGCYVTGNHDRVTVPGRVEGEREAVIEQSGGKVVPLPWTPPRPRS